MRVFLPGRLILAIAALSGVAKAQKEIPLWGRPAVSVNRSEKGGGVTFTVEVPLANVSMVAPEQLPDIVESMRLEGPGGTTSLEYKPGHPVVFSVDREALKETALVLGVMRFRAGWAMGIERDQWLSLQLILEGGESPIPALVAGLTSPFWRNGYGNMEMALPETASVEEVLTEFFRKETFGERRHVRKHYVLEARRVVVPGGGMGGVFTAVLVDTDLGRKIVLLSHEGSPGAWWGRVYDEPFKDHGK